MFFHPIFSIHLHLGVEALLRGGDEGLAREETRRFAERAQKYKRDQISYLRSLAILSEWEGGTTRAIDQLQEAQALAEKIRLPKERWQLQARIGELYDRRGQGSEAREAFSRAAQILRTLAQKIEDEKLREGFLAAPQVRRVLRHK